MPRLSFMLVLLVSLLGFRRAAAQDQMEVVNQAPETLATKDGSVVTEWQSSSGKFLSDVGLDSRLRTLLQKTLLQDPSNSPIDDQGFYCIIHLVEWSKQTIIQQAWLVYRGKPGGSPGWNSAAVNGQRLFGASKVGLLYVYINSSGSAPTFLQSPPTYKVRVARKTATPLQDLGGLLQFALTPGGGAKAPAVEAVAPPPPTIAWGGRVLIIQYTTSDISIEAFVPPSSSSSNALQSVSKQTFHNEGRSHWDVTVGVPVHSVSELSYGSTGGVVTAQKVNREKAYGMLDVYPWPVDLSASGVQWVPAIFGVSLAAQPFDHLILATGIGNKAVHAFVGAAFNNDHKPGTLQVGDSATPSKLTNDQTTHYSTAFVIGLNISVGQLLAAGKATTTSTGTAGGSGTTGSSGKKASSPPGQ